MTNWNQRFLDLARTVAGWSKDPSSQVGSVIVRPDKTVVSLGFNGLPRGISDSDENLTNRERKLDMVLHAETNAILTARGDTAGNHLYVWPYPPCSRCAAQIIQSGIVRVVYPNLMLPERWLENFALAKEMFVEAPVDFLRWPMEPTARPDELRALAKDSARSRLATFGAINQFCEYIKEQRPDLRDIPFMQSLFDISDFDD